MSVVFSVHFVMVRGERSFDAANKCNYVKSTANN